MFRLLLPWGGAGPAQVLPKPIRGRGDGQARAERETSRVFIFKSSSFFNRFPAKIVLVLSFVILALALVACCYCSDLAERCIKSRPQRQQVSAAPAAPAAPAASTQVIVHTSSSQQPAAVVKGDFQYQRRH